MFRANLQLSDMCALVSTRNTTLLANNTTSVHFLTVEQMCTWYMLSICQGYTTGTCATYTHVWSRRGTNTRVRLRNHCNAFGAKQTFSFEIFLFCLFLLSATLHYSYIVFVPSTYTNKLQLLPSMAAWKVLFLFTELSIVLGFCVFHYLSQTC